MAWGGGTMTGGAPMGGSRGSAGNPGNGLPFAGVPWEMRQGVEQLLADEPEREPPVGRFRHRMQETGVSLRRMLEPHRRMMTWSALFITLEALTVQAGPFLSQKGIDDGITPHDWTALAIIGVLAILVVVISALVERPPRRDDRPCRVARDVRAARPGVRSPAAPLPRLLHRREGRRDHDPHDQRHRIAATAHARRSAAVRAPGSHDGHRHGDPVLLQRRAHAHHAAHDRAVAHRTVVVVPLVVGPRLRAGARRDRERVERSLREPFGRARGHRLQPGPPQRAVPPQRDRLVPRRQRPHCPPRGVVRRVHRVRRVSSGRPCCSSSAATWCATATSPSASSSRSSSS